MDPHIKNTCPYKDLNNRIYDLAYFPYNKTADLAMCARLSILLHISSKNRQESAHYNESKVDSLLDLYSNPVST